MNPQKERPILFSGPMVRAIRDGRKTQTRRVVNPQPQGSPYFNALISEWRWIGDDGESGGPLKCPYGQPGDRLVVKEAAWMWCAKLVSSTEVTKKTGKPKVSWLECRNVQPIYCADHPAKPTHVPNGKAVKVGDLEYCWHKKNARFLPRWASRGLDEVVSIRVERLREISEADAVAEGIVVNDLGRLAEETLHTYHRQRLPAAVLQYADLWESINGPGSWALNPWVWVIEFKSVEGGSKA